MEDNLRLMEELDHIEDRLRFIASHAFKTKDYKLLTKIPVDLIPVKYSKTMGSSKNGVGLSFSTFLTKQRYLRQALKSSSISTEMKLDNKANGYAFCDSLKIKRPAVYQWSGSLDSVQQSLNINNINRFCLKPAVGGKGAWGIYVFYDGLGRSIKTGKLFSSTDDILIDAKNVLSKYKLSDNWIIEEVILKQDGSTANDLKCYTFYGNCPILLEVDRTNKKPLYAWWKKDGTKVDVGKYSDAVLDTVPPRKSVFEIAEKISKQIPAPFCRIDFLNGTDLYFGEFSPIPGKSDLFSREWDRKLGYEFVDAESRLYHDFRKHLSFNIFNELF